MKPFFTAGKQSRVWNCQVSSNLWTPENRSSSLGSLYWFTFCVVQTWECQFERSSLHAMCTIVQHDTVRWSNFDPLDPKMGVFLQSTQATPCGHVLKWKLNPENPPADTMFMAAMGMVRPWKIAEDFESFRKIRNFDPHFKNLYLARKWVWRAHFELVWKLVLRCYTFCLQDFWSDHSLEHSKPINEPQKNVQMTLKDQSFVNRVKVSFVCNPEDMWPSNFGKCLKMSQR